MKHTIIITLLLAALSFAQAISTDVVADIVDVADTDTISVAADALDTAVADTADVPLVDVADDVGDVGGIDTVDTSDTAAVHIHEEPDTDNTAAEATGGEAASDKGNLDPPPFALVLSGGGARGLAQIGVLKAFEEAGIKPDLIVASSMGSVVGGLYACGYSADEIFAIARGVDWRRVSSNANVRNALFVSQKLNNRGHIFDVRLDENFRPILPNSISNGQIFYSMLTAKLLPALYHAGNDFDRLPIRLRVVATDILTGRREVFDSGSLVNAIRASSAAPLAFSPVELDGKLLMDGGLTSNIPTQVAQDEGARFIVASDVTSPLWKRGELGNPVRFVEQIVAIGVNRNKDMDRRNADIIIRPQLSGITNTDFGQIDTLVERGYRAALDAIPAIKARLAGVARSPRDRGAPRIEMMPLIMKDRNGEIMLLADSVAVDVGMIKASNVCGNGLRALSPKLSALIEENGLTFATIDSIREDGGTLYVYSDRPTISDVRVFGNDVTAARLLLTAGNIKQGGRLDREVIDRGIGSLYSTELFENVRIEVDTGRRVDIHVNEKKYWRVRGGLRFDEFHRIEGFVEPAYENLFGYGVNAALHLQYGLLREKYALDLMTNLLFTPDWASSYRLQIFSMRENIYSREVFSREPDTAAGGQRVERPDSVAIDEVVLGKSGISLFIGGQLGKNVSIELGAKIESFELIETNRDIFDDNFGFGFRNSLPYFLLRFNFDTRDAVPFTTSGSRHVVTAGMAGEIIGLGGTEEFWKLDGSFNRYVTYRDRHTIHTQLLLGWANAPLPEVEKFYLGGAISEQNFRDADIYNVVPFMGLTPRNVSSDIFYLAHLEYRWRMKRHVYLSAMIDWARLFTFEEFNSFNPAGDFSPRNPLGAGLGLSIRTPLGPLRFTYGQLIKHRSSPFNEHKPVFYFSAGHDF